MGERPGLEVLLLSGFKRMRRSVAGRVRTSCGSCAGALDARAAEFVQTSQLSATSCCDQLTAAGRILSKVAVIAARRRCLAWASCETVAALLALVRGSIEGYWQAACHQPF